jgi:hypothetical protein
MLYCDARGTGFGEENTRKLLRKGLDTATREAETM